MENVILVIHLILALAIILLVLIQRSEGGGLGIGGGSGGGLGGLASPKGTANMLTRMTAIAAGSFFVTSLVLAILAGTHSQSKGILEAYDTVRGAETEDVDATSGENEAVSEEPSSSKPSVPIRE